MAAKAVSVTLGSNVQGSQFIGSSHLCNEAINPTWNSSLSRHSELNQCNMLGDATSEDRVT